MANRGEKLAKRAGSIPSSAIPTVIRDPPRMATVIPPTTETSTARPIAKPAVAPPMRTASETNGESLLGVPEAEYAHWTST